MGHNHQYEGGGGGGGSRWVSEVKINKTIAGPTHIGVVRLKGKVLKNESGELLSLTLTLWEINTNVFSFPFRGERMWWVWGMIINWGRGGWIEEIVIRREMWVCIID